MMRSQAMKNLVKKLKEKGILRMAISLLTLFLVSIPIFIGCAIYYFGETTHYVDTVCQISDCVVERTSVCYKREAGWSQRGVTYACYSGTYVITPEELKDINKLCNYTDRDYAFYGLCVNNATIYCSYNNHNPLESLSTSQQPVLMGFVLILLLTGAFIISSVILGSIILSVTCIQRVNI